MTRDAAVQIRLFGEPAVISDGVQLALPRMQGALLGALVLAGPGGAHSDPLADVLWPAEMPKTYETSLRVHVMKLRRSLGDEKARILIRRSQGGYALDPDGADVDVRRFSTLVDQARRHHRDGDAGSAFSAASSALHLWVGDPFSGLEDSVDAVAARSALEEQRVQACEIAGGDGRRVGRAEEVVEELVPMFAKSPTEERVGLPLIRALIDAGRAGEAVRVANELQHALRSELGVMSQAASELTEALQRAPSRPPRPTTEPPPLTVATDPTPFVGRIDELRRLLDQVTSPDPAATVTALQGPAGIGKTRLLRELAIEAHAAGVAVVYGRADRTEVPYSAISSMIDRVEASNGTLGGGLSEVVRSLVVEQLGDTWPRDPGLSHQAERSRLHDGVAAWLLTSDPVLIVVDDAQWLDPDTATLLRSVMDRGGRRRCHLVLAWRPGSGDPEAVEQLIADLADMARPTDIALRSLTKEASAELATHLGLADVDPVGLFERTAGNPLLIQEVARLEGQDLDPSDLLIDLVSRQFLADGDARELLRTAAVLGDRFTIRDLLAVSDLPDEQARQALSDCQREGILAVDRDGRAEFAHSVVADIILSSLSSVDRQRLHLQAFEALARSGGDNLAMHARAAFPFVDPADAVRSIAMAATKSQRRLAFERASILHDQAIELQEDTKALAPEEAVALFVEQARSLAHTDEARCDDVTRRAVSVAAGAATPAAVADLAEANVGRNLSGDADLMALLESALRWNPDALTSVRIRARLALERAESDRTDGPFRMAQQSLRDAHETGDLRGIGHSQRAMLSTGLHRVPRDEYRRLASDLVSTARAIPDLDLEMIGLIHLVIDRLRNRETEAAVSTLRGFQILADDRRWPRYQSFAAGITGVLAMTRGDRAEFQRRSARATDLANSCGFEDAAVMVAGQKVCLAWHDGTLASLTDILVSLHQATDGQSVVAAALACAFAEDRRPVEARQVAEAIDHRTLPRGMLYSTCLALLASYSLTAGDTDMAEGLLPELDGLTGTDIVAGAGVGHFGPVEGFLGRLHLTLGRTAQAAVAFDAAARSARAHQQTLALRRLTRDRASGRPAVG